MKISLYQKQKEYFTVTEKLKKDLNSSRKLGLKECNKCALCCKVQPCDFSRYDIYNAARYFSITPKEFFLSKLVIQKYGDNIQTVTPIRVSQRDIAGTFKPLLRTFDYDTSCTFLKINNECSLETIKPSGAKKVKCWENQEFKDIAVTWTNEEIYQLITDLDIELKVVNSMTMLFPDR